MNQQLQSPGYDVIGDIHGMGHQLVKLLGHLGYDDDAGYFRHPNRQAVFVGDLVDRGPQQVLAVQTVKAMVQAGSAHMVLGNHEIQVIELFTPHRLPERGHLMERTERHCDLHREFLDEVVQDSMLHRELIEWFMTVPMWLDLGDLRIVHACWDEASIANLGGEPTFTADILHAQAEHDSVASIAVRNLIRGPAVVVDPPWHYKGGDPIPTARFSWWLDHEATVGELISMSPWATAHSEENCLGIDGPPWAPSNPDARLTDVPVEAYPSDAPPLFFGHYWRQGTPDRVDLRNAVCVDFSACRGGPMVAYRWSGERQLTPKNFAWVPAEHP